MATQTFKFKRSADPMCPDNFRMSPSFGNDGIQGDDGVVGINGAALYFADYDIDNSYYKDVMLQRISTNKMLSSTKNAILSRPYAPGDIIITKSKMIYRITEATSGNYTMDLEYMGKLSRGTKNMNSPEISTSMIVDDLQGVDDGAIWNGIYMSSDVDGENRNRAKTMKYVTVTFDASSNSIDLADYDVALEVSMPNTKSIQGGSVPSIDIFADPTATSLQDIISFNKSIEIPMGTTIKISLSEGDMLHPSKNDIMGAFVEGVVKEVNAPGVSSPKYCTCIKRSNSSSPDMYIYETEDEAEVGTNDMFEDDSSMQTVMYSRIDDRTPNMRGGESRFFSGAYVMERDEKAMSYTEYANNCNSLESGDAYDSMIADYICSNGNTFTVILTNKETCEVTYIDVTKTIKITNGGN